MVRYLPFNPNSTMRVEETATIQSGKVLLRHIPKPASIAIDGFLEVDSLFPKANQFSCQYAYDSMYRDANRVLHFNAANNNQTITVNYIAVGTVVTADDMNEIKAHMENQSIHGTHYDLPTMGATLKGGAKLGNTLVIIDHTLNVALGTTPLTLEGSMWLNVP